MLVEQETPIQYNLYAYCWNNPINLYDPEGHWGITIGSFLPKLAAIASMLTPTGWVILASVAIIGGTVIYYANKDRRETSRIGRRNTYNTRKKAKEAAKRAGGGREPIHHPKGCHDNKKPHYHPNVKNNYSETPHGYSSHDHFYYPG